MKASHCCSMRKVAEGREEGRKAVDAALVRGDSLLERLNREFESLIF